MKPNENLDPLVIGGKSYSSRLLIGTGKYKDFAETKAAVEASGAQIVTVAIRRTNIGQNPGEPNLLDALPPSKYTMLPNTAGCYTADDAVRTLRLARELLDGHDLVKLEVLGDPKTLYPNVVETIAAAKTLVKDGFKVMVYTSDDPIIAKLAGRNRLCRGDAAGLTDRLGHGHPQSLESADHHRERQSAGGRRCRRRHRLGCRDCHGIGLRRCPYEYSDSRCK